ncbi:hypothetical protein Lal_00041760 [Lupinus albus]|nr:hypothetical protein Lal_00041760 [Lupinus albus]
MAWIAFTSFPINHNTPSRGRTAARRDPNFSPSLQASRLAKFHGRKLGYVRYVDASWLVEQGFPFPHELEVQGTNTFVELHGKLYPSLIREFYSNFTYQDGEYLTIVNGKVIVLDEDLFLAIGGLAALDHHWRNTNHAQPTIHDLKLLFAIREGILVNWPVEILKIDTSDVDFQLTNTRDHSVGEYLIHKMGIYWLSGEWMYQEDYRTSESRSSIWLGSFGRYGATTQPMIGCWISSFE